MITRVNILFTCMVCFGVSAQTHAHDLLPGVYEINVDVRLPNIPHPVSETRKTRCITLESIQSHDAFRIESQTPLADCERLPICMDGAKAGFQVICINGSDAKANATFITRKDSFTGSVSMNMGGKNMTVIEYQSGRRIGNCRAEL